MNTRPFSVLARSSISAVFLLTFLGGCDKSPQFGKVSGTVTMGGKPMDMVRVLFMPDPSAENTGAHSECITGDDGAFDLIYSNNVEIHGAIVGWHRVVLEDIAAEESRGEFRPIRIPAAYSSPSKTPFRFEVQAGDQNFDLVVEKKP